MMLVVATLILTMGVANLQALADEKLQEPIQAAALKYYLQHHPPTKGERVCVAVGGYKAPSKTLRTSLAKWRLDRSSTCHFREGQVVVGTTYAAMSEAGGVEVEVFKHEFGDISSLIHGFSYRLDKQVEWVVTWEGAPKR